MWKHSYPGFNNNANFVVMDRLKAIIILTALLVFIPDEGISQIIKSVERVKYDTSYITAYENELTTRIYLSRKQNGYNLSERLFSPWIKYRTNDNLLIGAGYTYSFLTLNLAVKMPFINQDDDLYGKTKYLDLQSHIILRSFIVDFYMQWNTGYYMQNPVDVYPGYADEPYKPIRGDMRTNLFGLNVQYLINSDRFSYKASFLQNQFQRKSAGSPIVGIEAYWMLAMTDSVTVAGDIPPSGFLRDRPFHQSDIFHGGFNGGYAYTFVWKEHLYFSLSTVVGLSGGNNRIHNTANSETYNTGITMGLNNTSRISLGYNNSSYYVGLSLIRFTMYNHVGEDRNWIGYYTGNIRFNVVKRFITKRPIKILRPDLWVY